MPVIVNTLNTENFRHSVNINNHEMFTDLPKSLGGDDSAPSPHDYFDAALASCKALTVKLYAQKKDIPLTGVTVEVTHDSSEEQKGKYKLNVKLTLKGVLTDEQRAELHRVADKCPVHKLMTTAEINIETQLAEGAFSQ
ncbi:OsmC family protein [Pseudomonas proteolytica]|uniref:OsmC family peroxiredoxin n=1 Tax=Pseudomonas proteolytica TaxID=219574 RepID=A0AAW5ABC2_9PSED|nr:OsmC family protein [Pseudomonas proteolytica]KAA8699070.1 OsmC family protein [Pseudomonas proteolytica]MCF5059976.1 OsmC family peroxiredoxin [Pseudomonas proteolytica]MCF5105047.1 OsmC family peroxiredoxin [Pseudomonas proteolytica]TWR82743.1 OsmC family protein [Pseudomonas proteolytica]SED99826.1 putative redox protein [Pseudomonas proteolytica]